jgi:glucose/arabinose dehydrogenase
VISPSGALFYTGRLFAPWRGNVLVGSLSSQAIVRLALNGEQVAVEERIQMNRRMRDLLQMPDGALLAIVDAQKGDLLRLTPVSGARSTKTSQR